MTVYTVCHSVCIFWTHYSMVNPHRSNFRIIKSIFWESEYLGIIRYLGHNTTGQTVNAQIRLPLTEQSDQILYGLLFRLHHLDALHNGKIKQIDFLRYFRIILIFFFFCFFRNGLQCLRSLWKSFSDEQ